MPKVLIDLYKLKNPYSGLGEFSRNFYESITSEEDETIQPQFLWPKAPRIQRKGGFTYHTVSYQKRYIPAWNPSVDLWHSLHQFPSHRPPRNTPWLLTVHDLNFLTEKEKRKAERYRNRLQKNVDRADCISTISHHTARELENHINLKGKKPVVIPNGVHLPSYPEAQLPDYLNTRPFFFSIGIFNAKKNFEVLIPLMHHFPGYHLVIAGHHATDYGNFIRKTLKEQGLEDRVHLPGKISDQEKYAFYTHAKAFLFPSLAEGFGLPVIEAMLAGTPVFLSTRASLPEIGGELAVYWPELQTEPMARVLREELEVIQRDSRNYGRALQEYAQRFTWDKCIAEYRKLYRSILTASGHKL